MVILTTKELPERAKDDTYLTPKELCRAAISFLADHDPKFCPAYALDPGAGEGVWGMAVKEKWPDTVVDCIEIRHIEWPPRTLNWLTKDYLNTFLYPVYDLIIGNPPYKYAEEFVRKNLSELESGGYLMLLLRLSFLESQGRARGLYKQFPPKQVAISARRVSFTGNRKTNDTAYAIYLWQNGYRGETKLTWLDWNYETVQTSCS